MHDTCKTGSTVLCFGYLTGWILAGGPGLRSWLDRIFGVSHCSLLHAALKGSSQAGLCCLSSCMRLGLEVGQLEACPVISCFMLLLVLLRSSGTTGRRPPGMSHILFINTVSAEGSMLLMLNSVSGW